MAEKKSVEDSHPSNADSYASRVFQESSVGMVSSLSQTTSLRRKAFKILALVLCLIGFFYQSGQFLAVVFQYPTTVDVDISRPERLTIPGYTFCDNNGISRRIFCEKYPDRCEMPTEDFCKRYESYCGDNITLVPMKQYYKLDVNMTLEEMVELNVDRDEFLTGYFIWQDFAENIENVTGPILRKKSLDEPAHICYSLNDRVNSSLQPRIMTKSPFFPRAASQLRFHIRSDETFLPGVRPGILFSVHSPFEAVNPFQDGIFMKAGRTYMIFVSMEEEILLQKPYPTDCVNYTELWEKRGKTGPRTQDMCFHECISALSMRCFNCVVPVLLYPTKERLCQPEEVNDKYCPSDAQDQFHQCELKCRDDCRLVKYIYKVQERYNPQLMENIESEDDIFSRIDVEIYLEGDEVVVLKHSPKYMIVEVFSSIGGFIGCWLGISLLDFADIFEGFFRIIRYSCKKKS